MLLIPTHPENESERTRREIAALCASVKKTVERRNLEVLELGGFALHSARMIQIPAWYG